MIPPHAIVPVQTIGASDDRIQRVEQMLRQLRVLEGMDVWDGFDSALVTLEFFSKNMKFRQSRNLTKFD